MSQKKTKFGNPAADLLSGEQHEPGHSDTCAAFGCPLAGALSPSTSPGANGNRAWYCFLHFGRQIGELDAITAKIREFAWIGKLAERTGQVALADWRLKASSDAGRYCQAKGRPDLAPQGEESPIRYTYRLRGELQKLCKPPTQDFLAGIDAESEPSGDGTRLGDFLREAA